MQTLTQMVVEVADGGRRVVEVKQIRKADILRGTREQVLKEWQTWSYMFVTWFSDLTRINAQLQVALVSLCRDEALTVVGNQLQGQEMDAWRRVSKEYEPSNEQSNLRLLKRQNLDPLRTSIED